MSTTRPNILLIITDQQRGDDPHLPVLAVSGMGDAEEMGKFAFDGFVEKPINLAEFRNVVDGVLGGN